MHAVSELQPIDCSDAVTKLTAFLVRHCIVKGDEGALVNSRGDPQAWMLDLRLAILDADASAWIVDELWSRARPLWPFQLAAQELAAVPLLGGMVAKGAREGLPIDGLIVRRDRKLHGRQRLVEGRLNGEKIILLDDIVNSGRSIARAIRIIADLGGSVAKVISLLDFENPRRDFGDSAPEYAFVLPLRSLGLPASRRTEPLDRRPLQVAWHRPSEGGYSRHVARKATPVVAGAVVLHATEVGRLSAINRSSGAEMWQRQLARRSKGLWSTPLVLGDRVYIGSYEGTLSCLDIQDGETVWTFDDADWIGSSPATDGERIFVGLEYALRGGCGAIVALDAKTGRVVWHRDVPSPVHATPSLSKDGRVLCGSNDGTLLCLIGETGEERWTIDIGGAVRSAAVFGPAGRRLFVGSDDGGVRAIDVDTGRIAWCFQTNGEVGAPPLLRGAFLYAPSADGILYKLCAQTGREVARQRLGGKIVATPAVDGDDLLVGSSRGQLVRIRIADFRATAVHDLDFRITSDIVVTEDHVYVAGADGELVAILRHNPVAGDSAPEQAARRPLDPPFAAKAANARLRPLAPLYNHLRSEMTEADLQVWQDFISERERNELVAWAVRMRPHLQANFANRQYRQTDTLPELPQVYTTVRERLERSARLADAEREPEFGWYLSVIESGGAVHSHLDPTRPGRRHLRCNLFLQLPQAGGFPVIEGQSRPLGEGDMLAFFPSERRHRSEVVGGDRARIICSFGYLVPENYALPIVIA
ncbi:MULTISPECIES: outer membrane protein assembly factor BamB family protein [unclassified Sphingomonas]|uniref:outer membrane protein assembly factor BamB family protein n=1 Tax=unclassified Sphingomonas TaxID=196159 RepID=UPI0006F6686C|nr:MULTISPECIES: PQQ-binding-like beta-propeller repeat protein [unclassified Sphingomonas]KQS51703.1 hypothetical protein ASG20_06940 [Sphingomonas sp. Leaf198]